MKTLKSRLLLASIVVMPLALGSTGLALDRAFRASLEAAEQTRLERYFYLLFSIADIHADQQGLSIPPYPAEPDFENPSSGILGFVYNREGEIIWQSNSAALSAEIPQTR